MHQRTSRAVQDGAERQGLGNAAQWLRKNLQWCQYAAQYQRQAAEDETERIGILSPESQQPNAKVGDEVDAQRQKCDRRPCNYSHPGEMRRSHKDERYPGSDYAIDREAHQPLAHVLCEVIKDITAWPPQQIGQLTRTHLLIN